MAWHPYRGRVVERLAAAFKDAGLPFRLDVNARGQQGYSFVQTTTERGERASSFRAYLGPALRRRNLRVVTYATVTRVLVEGFANTEGNALPRATGVEYVDAAGRVGEAGRIGQPNAQLFNEIYFDIFSTAAHFESK